MDPKRITNQQRKKKGKLKYYRKRETTFTIGNAESLPQQTPKSRYVKEKTDRFDHKRLNVFIAKRNVKLGKNIVLNKKINI